MTRARLPRHIPEYRCRTQRQTVSRAGSFILLMCAILPVYACSAQDDTDAPTPGSPTPPAVETFVEPSIASVDDATYLRNLASQFATITSVAELQAYRHFHDTTPLDAFTPLNRAKFIRSLRFFSGRLGGWRYDVFAEDLTPGEAYAVLSLFGYQEMALRVVTP